jgi:segregation and condensation protein B
MGRATLETLAIVAYRQPVTKAEIEAIRGVDVDGVVNTLMERSLIRAVGRKDVPGRPFLFGTTPEFLQLFNMKDLSELPTLKELDEITLPEPVGEGVLAERVDEEL